jgi:hypothetical protein
MKQKRSPKKPNVYFTKETEDAIVLYNSLEDDIEKNILYTQKIHPAFYKLAEIMIHRFKFYNFDVSHEDVKHEVITFLHEKMNKYKAENGKAFSYFSIVAKNYLIAENNKNYYHYKRSHSVDVIDTERVIINEIVRNDLLEEKRDFIDIFSSILEKNLTIFFTKNRDIQVADTILYLFKTRENIENYNKKAIYILVRERTGVNSQHITSVINKIKIIYGKLYKMYKDGKNIEKINWYDFEKNITN